MPEGRADVQSLRALLTGGDRRSLARSNDARALVRADEKLVAELARLAQDDDRLVVMRALDLMEKLAHEHADWVQRYRGLFSGTLAEHESWEIRLQIARALPLLQWTHLERPRVLAILRRYADDPQKFVRAWAVDGLSRLAEGDAAIAATVQRHLEDFEQSDSAALKARARHIRLRLQSRDRA